MPAIPSFDEIALQRICDVLGDTTSGLSGTQIGKLLAAVQIADPAPTLSKRYRLFEALVARQRQDQCANNVVNFIQSAMAPVRYTSQPEVFEARRTQLNAVLVFVGYRVATSGKLVTTAAAETLAEVKPVADQQKVDVSRLRELFREVQRLDPHPRGFAFEKFLVPFFAAYRLDPRQSFRLVGEQIDGSFLLDNDTYLVEARWENELTGNRDLQAFSGQVTGKSGWSRGLFISYSGFSTEGLEAFGRGNPTRILCMDGLDLSHILSGELDLGEVIRRKARRATETSRAFVPVRELFPNVI